MKSWEPKPPGNLWTTPGLLRDSFTFIFYEWEIRDYSLQGVVDQHTLTLILSTYMLLPHTRIMKLVLMLVKYLIISELLSFPSLP